MSAENPSRAELEARLTARLSSLDEAALRQLDATLGAAQEEAARAAAGDPPADNASPAAPDDILAATASESPPGSRAISRRDFLLGAVAGGLVVTPTNLLTAFWATSRGEKGGAARARQAVQPELTKLRNLVKLYETLEQIGIDEVISTGIAILEVPLKAVREGSKALQAGLGLADAALTALEGALPALGAGLALAEGLVSVTQARLKIVQQAAGEVGGKLSPLADAIGSFFSAILSRIPFGVGERIQDGISKITELITSLPSVLDGINNQLLLPLKNDWLSAEEGKGLRGRLTTPLRQKLLEPLKLHLGDLAALSDSLEQRLFGPAKAAIEERKKIRQQITDYRQANAL
jgi:hypothetical protein